MTTSLLSAAFAHHFWATERLIEACTVLTPQQLQTPVPGTYGSILDAFRHLAEGDSLYLSVVSGQPAAPTGGEASLAEVRSLLRRNGAAWTALLARDLDPDADVVELDNGWEFHIPMGVRLAQVVQHGTDHRSQVCTALTSLGMAPPEIDVWAFAEATGRTRAGPAPAQ